MAAAMTGLAVLIISNAAAAGLVFMAGHKRGRRSCRNEYPDGWDDARPSGFARHEGDVRPELLDAFRRALAGDVSTVTGIVVTPRGPGPDPAADWDLLAGAALPDYAAAALGGQRTVDECVDSIVLRAVGR